MDNDKHSKARRPKLEGRTRRRVDPSEEQGRPHAARAESRVAKSLADQDEAGSAAELARLRSIGKKGGDSPREVTVRWVDNEGK